MFYNFLSGWWRWGAELSSLLQVQRTVVVDMLMVLVLQTLLCLCF